VKVVSVMPCYDKKLEAVRPNFTLNQNGDLEDEEPAAEIKEVDTVLATHELTELVKEFSDGFDSIPLYQHKRQEDDEMKGSPSGWGFMEIM
jgi:iron only hydrogenase large subunit-like protein